MCTYMYMLPKERERGGEEEGRKKKLLNNVTYSLSPTALSNEW